LTVEVDINEDYIVKENLHHFFDSENLNGDDQEDFSIFDPRTWENLDNIKTDLLIEKGSVREHVLLRKIYWKMLTFSTTMASVLLPPQHSLWCSIFATLPSMTLANPGLHPQLRLQSPTKHVTAEHLSKMIKLF
jgi:hypothetical protein